MLTSKNLDDKTYQELLGEAIMQIPLYSREWTNHNPSDPGITILENLTAFEALQQNTVNQITPAIKQKLLKMVGFEGRKGKAARVLLAAENLEGPLLLPAGQRFQVGDLCFETNRAILLSGMHLTGVLGKRSGTFYDYSFLTDREVPVPAQVFGEKPKKGDSLYFLCDGLPQPGEEVIFYLNAANRQGRNPFEERGRNTFAGMKWECYTENGFEQVNVKDNTGCFLVSGEVRLRMPRKQALPCPEVPGETYVIRATLERADYDISPRLVTVSGFLFEIWQKETKSACYTFNKLSQIELSSELAEKGYLQVFCKEEKGSSYRRYEPWAGREEPGRFYETQQESHGTNWFYFDKKRFKYGPEKLKNAVKIMVYDEEMMRRYDLGKVLGCDNQTIQLPVKNIVGEFFSVVALRTDADGEEIYDFVRPGHNGEEDLTYYLLENEGRIVIEDAGAFIGAQLFMGACSITRGQEGNVRENNRFSGEHMPELSFYNPGPGTGGCFRESLQDVKKRFLEDLHRPYTAVTAADYERVIRETPELCIHKVKSVLDERNNVVRIAVKPDTDEKFPQLSETYKKALQQRVEEKRLLTTRVEIVSPAYLPVNANAVIYVKRHYENAEEIIRNKIKELLDDIHSDRNFGEVLKFDRVFRVLEDLECVEFVYDLALYPQNPALGKLLDTNIVPQYNCLCCAGNIVLEIRTFEG